MDLTKPVGVKKQSHSFIPDWFLRVLLGATLLLMIVGSCVNIPGVIDSPEFKLNLDPNWVYELLTSKGIWLFYRSYFYLDFVWYIIISFALYHFIFAQHIGNLFKWAKFSKISLILILVSLCVANGVENVLYCYFYRYEIIALIVKLAFLALSLLWVLLILLYKYFQDFLPTFLGFLKSAAYSLIILGLIGFLLPKAPQINSIVVNLYDSPTNFLVLLIVAPIYAMAIAHYPSYFNIDETKFTWYSAKGRVWWFATIFYKNIDPSIKEKIARKQHREDFDYQPEKPDTKTPEKPVISYLNFMLRTLGILFFAALFYIIGYASQVNFDWPVSISRIGIALLGVCLYLLFYLRNRKTEWLNKNYAYLHKYLPNFYDGDYTPKKEQILNFNLNDKEIDAEVTTTTNKPDPSLSDINKWVRRYLFLFMATILLHILLFSKLWFIDCPDCRYNNFNALLSLVCIGFQMFTFVYYRTFRSGLRFSLYNEKSKAILNSFYVLRVIKVTDPLKQIDQEHVDINRKKIQDFFKANEFIENAKDLKMFKWLRFGIFSNNITYLQTMAVIGVINTLYLIVINIWSKAALFSNAILIILSYLFFYYGVIVLITKSFIYYKYSDEVYAKEHQKKFYFSLTIVAFVFITLNVLKDTFRNELFTLKLIDRDKTKEITIEDYVANLPKDQTRYYIGSYGGGMKANAWTMTVLKQLYDTDPNFFKKVVGISGVSGGTMGLTNMAGIINAEVNPENWQKTITTISTSNILAIDLSHILGKDTFEHLFIPFRNLRGKDRSSVAMNQYAQITNNSEEIKHPTAYRKFWKNLYEKENRAFPILISNSTNVVGNQGMAVSVSAKKGSPEDSYLYQGANNILDIYQNKYEDNPYLVQEKTLSYYDAASTSNRFPILSPATKIETLGHFNDGGIYENSGMLSAFKLFRAVNCIEGVDELQNLKQRNVFINIVNDKNTYIKYKVSEHLRNGISINKINENTEINAIIASIASTEMMPIFIKAELNRLADYNNIEFYTIYLPHRFTVADVKMIYGSDIEFGEGFNVTYKEMYHTAINNNAGIEQLVTNGCSNPNIPIIEPPMSRVMADAAYEFMLQMRNHPIVQNAIKLIIDKD